MAAELSTVENMVEVGLKLEEAKQPVRPTKTKISSEKCTAFPSNTKPTTDKVPQPSTPFHLNLLMHATVIDLRA